MSSARVELEPGRRAHLVGVPRFCLECGCRGHYSRRCPDLGLAGVVGKHGPHRCTECDRTGHNIRTCPRLKGDA